MAFVTFWSKNRKSTFQDLYFIVIMDFWLNFCIFWCNLPIWRIFKQRNLNSNTGEEKILGFWHRPKFSVTVWQKLLRATENLVSWFLNFFNRFLVDTNRLLFHGENEDLTPLSSIFTCHWRFSVTAWQKLWLNTCL